MTAYELFESYECDRCSGQGVIRAFSGVWGGRCFKCSGAKQVFTKRGRRDYDAWRAAVDAIVLRPATDVVPGSFVKLTGMRKYVEVAAVEADGSTSTATSLEGVVTSHTGLKVRLVKTVRIDTGTMLGSYDTDSINVWNTDTVRIHPGVGHELPKAAEFDSRKPKAA